MQAAVQHKKTTASKSSRSSKPFFSKKGKLGSLGKKQTFFNKQKKSETKHPAKLRVEKPSKKINKKQGDKASKHIQFKPISGEKVPSKLEQKQKIKKAAKGKSKAGGVLQFTSKSPSQMASSYANLGKSVSKKLNDEQKETQDTMPKLKAVNGEGKVKLIKKQPKVSAKGAKKLTDVKGKAKANKKKPASHKFIAPPPKNKKGLAIKKSELGAQFDTWATENFFDALQVSDPNLSTSAGEKPTVDTTGGANPERAEIQRMDADRQVTQEKDAIKEQILANPSQERVQPVSVDEEYRVKLPKEKSKEIATSKNKVLTDYTQAKIPANVRRAADQKLSVGLDPKIAKQRAEITKKAQEKNTAKQESIAKAEKKTHELSRSSAEKQRQAIDKNRAEIAAKEEASFREVEGRMRAYENEVDSEQSHVDTGVRDKINKSNQDAGKKIEQAEKDAAKEKAKAEQKAQKIKEEEKRKNEERSWWDWAAEAIESAVEFVTEQIDAVFTLVRETIKTIIDTAKQAALQLIESARAWIVSKLDAFRDWLKSKINQYLAAFPAIQNALNSAIDMTVNFAINTVNRVAEVLKSGVKWLAENLARVIDGILAKFQTALKAAVQVIGAILTGDFSRALEIAFMATCELAGIDPNPILNFIRRVRALMMDIFMDPLRFITNLGRGIQKGLNQFLTNIKQHLISGVIGWLTGALSSVAIQLPERWDIKGIFYLVAQILGVTYEQIRAKVVKRLGRRGEQIVSTIETTARFVKRLVVEGPIALWDMIKQQLSNLKQMVISELSQWLTITVIKQGILWLLSLTNPASAILKAVKMIFDVIMFLKNRFAQIRSFVLSIYHTLSAIVHGNVQKMADNIEQALGRTIPLVIGFMASLLGLSGIGKTVKRILKKVRRPIDRVINKVVDKIVKMARPIMRRVSGVTRRVRSAARRTGRAVRRRVRRTGRAVRRGAESVRDRVVGWWKQKERFRGKDGHTHTLYFSGSGNSARLMVASNPRTFHAFINTIEVGEDSKKIKAKNKALGIAQDIDDRKNDSISGSEEEVKKRKKQEKAEAIDDLLEELATHVRVLFDMEGDLPDSDIDYNSADIGGDTMGESMTAKILTKEGDAGSTPTQSRHAVFDKLNKRRYGNGSYYIRGHLLNHNVHGVGQWKNMTPLSRKGNKDHEAKAESTVKRAVESGAIVYYSVKPNYNRKKLPSIPDAGSIVKKIREAEEHVPTELIIKADLLKPDPNKEGVYIKKSTLIGDSIKNPVETNKLEDYQISDIKEVDVVALRSPGENEKQALRNLKTIEGIGGVRARELYNLYLEKGSKLEYKHIKNETSIPDTVIDKLKKSRDMRLEGPTTYKS